MERAHCPTDRRVAWAQLTPAGLARIEEAVPVHLRHLDAQLVEPLGADDLAQLTAAMRILRDHVNPGAAQVGPEAQRFGPEGDEEGLIRT